MPRPSWIVAAVFGVAAIVGGLLAFSPDGASTGDDDPNRGSNSGSTAAGSAAGGTVDASPISGTFLAKHDITSRNGPDVTHVSGETRATFSLDPIADGKFAGTASVTATFTYESTGSEVCPRYYADPVSESWIVRLTGEVIQGQLFLDGDPDGNPERRVTVKGCAKDDTILADWMPFDIWRNPITFTDHRYDLREEWPVRENETGLLFQEIHMRQPGR